MGGAGGGRGPEGATCEAQVEAGHVGHALEWQAALRAVMARKERRQGRLGPEGEGDGPGGPRRELGQAQGKEGKFKTKIQI